MTDNTEEARKEPVNDLQPSQITDADAAAIRGGSGLLGTTVGATVKGTGEALKQVTTKG